MILDRSTQILYMTKLLEKLDGDSENPMEVAMVETLKTELCYLAQEEADEVKRKSSLKLIKFFDKQ